MELNVSPEAPTQDTANNVAECPQTESADEVPDSQNIPDSSEVSSATQDPLLPGGKHQAKKRATTSSGKAGRQLNQSSAPKPPTSSVSLLIFSAVASCQKKSGLSMQALKKMVANMGYDVARKKHYFLRAVRNMVAKGQIWQIKGSGATGSFKINPDLEKKNLPKRKRKGPKSKQPIKNKKSSSTSRKGREAAKKQVKADVKRTCKRGKANSVQAGPSQVKV